MYINIHVQFVFDIFLVLLYKIIDILQCCECKNYVCSDCAHGIAERPRDLIRCPFCDKQPFVLDDVMEKDLVRKYMETQRNEKSATNEESRSISKENNSEKFNNRIRMNSEIIATEPRNKKAGYWNSRYEALVLGKNYAIDNGIKQYYRSVTEHDNNIELSCRSDCECKKSTIKRSQFNFETDKFSLEFSYCEETPRDIKISLE